jgi:hypothetical protein
MKLKLVKIGEEKQRKENHLSSLLMKKEMLRLKIKIKNSPNIKEINKNA